MSPSQLYLVCLMVVLLYTESVLAQTVVENKYCDAVSLDCGAPDKPASQKYCCADAPGLFKCCNPYIGLVIGLSVGVPLIILIIVGVIVLYCCCARYHNRKMMAMAMAYREREEQEEEEESTLAPPPYSHSGDTKGSELPSYTVTDPYGQLPAYEEPPTTESVELESTTVEPEDVPLLN